ncbi:MAG: long-chain fatty acid--CoA ligase, partial [Dysgonamonadaceae bacterium]|nr:long-chain fatty acid--CoA ligase [Dysgonamonadaceae bacterium]
MGKTIIGLLNETVDKYGENPYLYEALNNIEYTALTFNEVKEQSIRFAAGLIAMGIDAGERISLISEGKNYWVIGEL